MGQNAKATDFLKECMADALIQKMQEKPFEKVTVNEIADLAGVNRSTWFRNFKTKNDALSFKIVILWNRYRNDHGLSSEKYTLDNAPRFIPLSMMVSIRL